MEKVYEKQRKKAASLYMKEVLARLSPNSPEEELDDCNINWAFQSGADWEHERSKVLVEALQYYATDAKFCAEPNIKVAAEALNKYGNTESRINGRR